MKKRPITPTYLFFYLLFWPDTWRIVIGLVVAALVAPLIEAPEHPLGPAILFVMLGAIGYSVSAVPGRKIGRFFRDRVLKNRRP